MNLALLALLLAAGAVAVGLATVGTLMLSPVRDWRRSRELRAINADPSQHPIGV